MENIFDMIEQITDLHIHSKYARACSKELELPAIAKACEQKGIQIVSTGDFTHPLWFKNIENELEEVGKSGLFRLRRDLSPALSSAEERGANKTWFILGTEITVVYKHKDATRRLHLLIYAPSLAAARQFNQALEGRGANIHSDGRPIMGIPAKEIVTICKAIDPAMMVIPAHAWTPWFAVFGSKSGYNSLEECFEDLTPKIFAIETGLSSDPTMNRRLSALDNITLISNSDAHSLPNLGREANVFGFESEKEITYAEIRRILKEGDRKKFLYTIEFYPEEGMYHFDGHRDCGVSLSPEQTKRVKGICPKCKKKLTIGVLYRVDELADRAEIPKKFIPHKYIVPLREIIAASFDVGVGSKKVAAEYARLLSALGSEFYILLQADSVKIEAAASSKNIALGIQNVRENKVIPTPGYDGVYGRVDVFAGAKYEGPKQSVFL